MDIMGIGTSFLRTAEISILEAIMLICWGVSWPVSIIKTLRTKQVYGKSPTFMALIAFGYVSAILHKILYSYDYLVWLYLFNLLMILTDLSLYARYNLRVHPAATKLIPVDESTADKLMWHNTPTEINYTQ